MLFAQSPSWPGGLVEVGIGVQRSRATGHLLFFSWHRLCLFGLGSSHFFSLTPHFLCIDVFGKVV
jgi:hypothetical protein